MRISTAPLRSTPVRPRVLLPGKATPERRSGSRPISDFGPPRWCSRPRNAHLCRARRPLPLRTIFGRAIADFATARRSTAGQQGGAGAAERWRSKPRTRRRDTEGRRPTTTQERDAGKKKKKRRGREEKGKEERRGGRNDGGKKGEQSEEPEGNRRKAGERAAEIDEALKLLDRALALEPTYIPALQFQRVHFTCRRARSRRQRPTSSGDRAHSERAPWDVTRGTVSALLSGSSGSTPPSSRSTARWRTIPGDRREVGRGLVLFRIKGERDKAGPIRFARWSASRPISAKKPTALCRPRWRFYSTGADRQSAWRSSPRARHQSQAPRRARRAGLALLVEGTATEATADFDRGRSEAVPKT